MSIKSILTYQNQVLKQQYLYNDNYKNNLLQKQYLGREHYSKHICAPRF